MKTVKEIDIELKNQPGELSKVSEILGHNGVNIIAFYVATEEDRGKLRFVAMIQRKRLMYLRQQDIKSR